MRKNKHVYSLKYKKQPTLNTIRQLRAISKSFQFWRQLDRTQHGGLQGVPAPAGTQ